MFYNVFWWFVIYIYSGDVPALDKHLRDSLGPRHRILLIPASPSANGDAVAMAACLREVGLRASAQGARVYRNPQRLRHVLMNSDAVFLLGGNTYDFLDFARTMELFSLLAEFEREGGIIAAESAGSILLSPTIATAAIPTFDADEHTVIFDDYRAMGRIPFHISPHYDPKRPQAAQDIAELRALACASRTPVLVLRDGEGFIMDGTRVVDIAGRPLWLEPHTTPEFPVQIPDWTLTNPYPSLEDATLF